MTGHCEGLPVKRQWGESCFVWLREGLKSAPQSSWLPGGWGMGKEVVKEGGVTQVSLPRLRAGFGCSGLDCLSPVQRSTIASLWICLSCIETRRGIWWLTQAWKTVNILYLLGFFSAFHLLSPLSLSWRFVTPQQITKAIRMDLGLQAKRSYSVVPTKLPVWCWQVNVSGGGKWTSPGATLPLE